MRVKTLVATGDRAYTGHISGYISEHHADTMEISVCNTIEHLNKMLSMRQYDIALMDAELIKEADLGAISLPLLLWSSTDANNMAAEYTNGFPAKRISKHQRISSTVANVLEQYAAVSGSINIAGEKTNSITVVWSPAGGVGKTTVALAYATSCAVKEEDVFYLSLETFAGTGAFFSEQGKSISAVFEMLERSDGSVNMLVQGICNCENGIKYLSAPENFDDMSILSTENVRELVICCAGITSELVIDLSSICDANTRQVFELAEKVLLVTDYTNTAQMKLAQFVSQSNVYESIKDKVTFVANKDANVDAVYRSISSSGAVTEQNDDIITPQIMPLPYIHSADVQFVYKALAKSGF